MRRALALALLTALAAPPAPAQARDFLGDLARRAEAEMKAAAAAKAERAARAAVGRVLEPKEAAPPAAGAPARPGKAPAALPDDADWAAGRARLQAPHLRGRVSGPGLDVRDRRVSPAEGRALTAAADALVFGPLMATPALADPTGFSIRRSVVVDPPSQGLPAGAPAVARGTLLALQIQPDQEKQPDAAGTWRGWGEGPSVEFAVNDPAALFFYPDEDGRRPGHHTVPVTTPARDGFMVLRFSTRDHLVITKPGRRPWRHVTKAEVLQRRIEDARAGLAGFDAPSDAPAIQRDLAGFQAELAALPPAERAAPACTSNEFKYGTFTPCDVAGAEYVVAYDPGYFDPSLPKTAIQLVVISEPVDHRDDHPDLGPVLRGAVRALDLRAIQASLR